MAVTRLISAGNSSVVLTVTTATTAGDLKVIGEALQGRCMETKTSGSTVAYMVPTTDVWRLPSSVSTGGTGVIGDFAYYVSGTTNVISLSTGNGAAIGVYHKAVTQAGTTCEVRMAIAGVGGGDATIVDGFTMNDAADIAFNTTTGTKLGTSTSQKIAFFNSTPIVQPTALTSAETTLTNAGTASDWAIQAMSSATSAFGFVSQAEGESVVQVVLNNQLRIGEIETKLQALGLVA